MMVGSTMEDELRYKQERDGRAQRWLTVADVAEHLEINAQTARRMMRRGDIPAHKIGGEYKVRVEEYAEWLEQQRVRPES